MKRLLLIMLLILSGMAFTEDDSYRWTAQSLQEQLKANSGFDGLWAGGYVAGVADALNEQGIICPDPAVRYGEIDKVVIKYIDDNPTTMHLSRLQVIRIALMRAYPCHKLANPQFLDKPAKSPK